MNYFEFYQIPVSFRPDKGLVRKKYIEISRSVHPDFFIDKTSTEKELSLDKSTINTNAYQVLTDDDRVVQYVLSLYNLIEEGEKYQLPQDFLSDMMDINEKLMETQLDFDRDMYKLLVSEINLNREKIDADMQKAIDDFESDEVKAPALLLMIKDAWYRKKYLLRIQERLDTFANQ